MLVLRPRRTYRSFILLRNRYSLKKILLIINEHYCIFVNDNNLVKGSLGTCSNDCDGVTEIQVAVGALTFGAAAAIAGNL